MADIRCAKCGGYTIREDVNTRFCAVCGAEIEAAPAPHRHECGINHEHGGKCRCADCGESFAREAAPAPQPPHVHEWREWSRVSEPEPMMFSGCSCGDVLVSRPPESAAPQLPADAIEQADADNRLAGLPPMSQAVRESAGDARQWLLQHKDKWERLVGLVDGVCEIMDDYARSRCDEVERERDESEREGIEAGLKDVRAGRVRPLDEIEAEIEARESAGDARQKFVEAVADFILGMKLVPCGNACEEGLIGPWNEAIGTAANQCLDFEDNEKLLAAADAFARSRCAAAERDLEQVRVQLAGCSVAALGWAHGKQDAKPGDYGYSASYADVKDLRRKCESVTSKCAALEAENAKLRAQAAAKEEPHA